VKLQLKAGELQNYLETHSQPYMVIYSYRKSAGLHDAVTFFSNCLNAVIGWVFLPIINVRKFMDVVGGEKETMESSGYTLW